MLEGGFRVPCIVRWPGKVPAGKVENGIMSGLDWFPTFVAAAGNPEHRRRAEEGQAARRHGPTRSTSTATTRRDLITGKGPSKRHEIFYFAEGTLGAVRIDDYKYRFIDQPERLARRHGQGRLADPDQPPPRPVRAHGHLARVARHYYNWFVYEFWRFVFVQQEVAKVAADLHRVPADAEGATFNLEAVKEQIQKAIAVAPRRVRR